MPVPVQAEDAAGPTTVARIEGRPIHCAAEPTVLERCAAALLALLRTQAEHAYIEEHALYATEAEIEAVFAYERAFRSHDRLQRSRKLLELEARLASGPLATEERSRLEAFRTVLARLARYDADVDAGIEKLDVLPRETAAAWVQQVKLDKQLHRRFGGVIGVRASGLYAHGARVQMLRQFVPRQQIEWLDSTFRGAFERVLGAAPTITYRGQQAEFTPFWLRPIPDSYMHD